MADLQPHAPQRLRAFERVVLLTVVRPHHGRVAARGLRNLEAHRLVQNLLRAQRTALNQLARTPVVEEELAELGSLRPEIPILRVLRIGEFQRDIRLAVAQILLRATAARKHCDAQHE